MQLCSSRSMCLLCSKLLALKLVLCCATSLSCSVCNGCIHQQVNTQSAFEGSCHVFQNSVGRWRHTWTSEAVRLREGCARIHQKTSSSQRSVWHMNMCYLMFSRVYLEIQLGDDLAQTVSCFVLVSKLTSMLFFEHSHRTCGRWACYDSFHVAMA